MWIGYHLAQFMNAYTFFPRNQKERFWKNVCAKALYIFQGLFCVYIKNEYMYNIWPITNLCLTSAMAVD